MARVLWLVAVVVMTLLAFPTPGSAQDTTAKRYEYTTGFGSVSSPRVRSVGEATSYVTGKISGTTSRENFEGKTTLSVATPPVFGTADVANFTWKYEDCGRAFEFGRWTEWQCTTSTPPGTMQRFEIAPPTCSANTTMSSGFYDIGASSGANPPVLGCKGGCAVVFDGSSPAGSALVNGEKHWYAKGSYIATGDACPATAKDDSDFLSKSSSALPEDSCGANKGQGSINGRTVCYDKTEDMEGGKQDEGSKDKETSKTETQKGVNPDGSEWTKEITIKVDVDGVKTTTTTTTTTRPDGTKSTETTTEHEGRPPSDKPSDDDDEEQTECQKNPSGKDCGGAPAAVGESYTKKTGTKTFEEVLKGAGDALSGSEFGHAVSAFFSVSGGGSCPVVSGTIPMLNASFTFDSFCTSLGSTVFLVIRGVLLLVASFFAFRVALE